MIMCEAHSDNGLIAWNLVLEIMHRSKEPLHLVTLHPCDGQYKCLTLLRGFEEGPLMMANLYGTSIKTLQDNNLISPYQEMFIKDKEALLSTIARYCKFDLSLIPVRRIPALEFLIDLISRGMDVTSTWMDSSYYNCLSDSAKDFPYYPLKDVRDARAHWPWWIIQERDKANAVVNIETGELILSSGKTFNINNGERDVAMDYLTKLSEWKSTIANTRELLRVNTEWQQRYAVYEKEISANIETIKKARQTFREWEPLKLYLNTSSAKNAKKIVNFELRYLGQTVAELVCSNGLKLNSAKYATKNERDFECAHALTGVDWDSSKARQFRKHFKNLVKMGKVNNPSNEEHRYESLILTEMSKTKNKSLPFMKSVKIGGLRFPMPTPLKASDHKSVSYSSASGGGIDIFARTGTGGVNTNLCIMELKDENVPAEPPKDVIKQALVYTTFIRELLRSDSGDAWWMLFGFAGKIPEKLVLFSVCIMPSNDNNDTSFKDEELQIGGDDIARLHYIYFTESNNQITGVDTSLNLQRKI